MQDPRETQFTTALDTHGDALYRVCRAYGRDDAESRDLHQEVLIRVWEGLRGFRGDSALGTWLYRVAVNTCLSWRRKETRRARRLPIVGERELASVQQPEPDRIDTSENLKRLYACIAQLGPIDRLLASLYLEELPHAQIAQVLGTTEGAVRVRVHRIQDRLRELSETTRHEPR